MATNNNKSTTFKKYDRNRFRKIYPVNRYPTSNSFRSNEEVVMESLSIPFTTTIDNAEVRGSETATGALQESYTAIPALMVSAKLPPDADFNALSAATRTVIVNTMNVNLFISEITLNPSTGIVSFTISASDWFAGDAAITVMGLG